MRIDEINGQFARLENSFGHPCTLDRDDLLRVVHEALKENLITWSDLWRFKSESAR